MLSIFATTDYHNQLEQIINQEQRLDELIVIYDILEDKPTPNGKHNSNQEWRDIFSNRLA